MVETTGLSDSEVLRLLLTKIEAMEARQIAFEERFDAIAVDERLTRLETKLDQVVEEMMAMRRQVEALAIDQNRMKGDYRWLVGRIDKLEEKVA